MMSLYTLLLLLGLASAPTSLMETASYCPAASPSQTEYVKQWFASDLTRPFREQHGLLGVLPANVRPLTDAQDAAVCQRIGSAVTLPQTGPYPKVWTGYQAGAFYVMHVTTRVPAGVFHYGGGTGVVVLDANMNVVGIAS